MGEGWGVPYLSLLVFSFVLFCFYTRFVSMGMSVCSEICMWIYGAAGASWGHLKHIHTIYMRDKIHLPSDVSNWIRCIAYLDGKDLIKVVNGIQDVIHLIWMKMPHPGLFWIYWIGSLMTRNVIKSNWLFVYHIGAYHQLLVRRVSQGRGTRQFRNPNSTCGQWRKEKSSGYMVWGRRNKLVSRRCSAHSLRAPT